MPLGAFTPAVRDWFARTFGAPTPPQREGWPAIQEGKHTLIAAPTGSGKTLAAFLWAIDALLRQGASLPDATQVLYVSPLKALGNDIQKNLQGPLAEIAAQDLFLPEIRVMVRSGDTTGRDRAAMLRRPPHILVTTPESLYILLTSDGGRNLMRTVRTVIVDEVHAVLGDKRGAHLALSLERLEAIAGPVQRIGLSATQKPLSDVGNFLAGVGRECTLVDTGHLRQLDVAVEVPPSPLSAVCSHEQWEEIYARVAQLIVDHRTTLLFVNTRKMAERVAARLTKVLGEEQVTCHHGSLSKERRLDAERRLKEGKLRALVATASLELGIDIGDVDLVIQIAATRSIATFLQRVGRSGHALGRIPKGRIFPLTLDELAEAAALLRCVRRGELDRTPQPGKPLDILAQQTVASCVAEPWSEDDLYERFKRAWPYRELAREDFDDVVKLHGEGRHALLHRDGVNKRVRATRRARITALTGGGAIPDIADYKVVQEPEGTHVGTLDEDFSVESNAGDIVQLGNTSWRILRVESREGIVRVADAKGQPPTLPFWLGEAPARTVELSAGIGDLREEGADVEWLVRETGVDGGAAQQLAEYIDSGRRALGAVPTQKRVIAERFFDESGGMQLVIHSPFGGRINRAWGLALRKCFCRGFGFELQAAANEEALLLSLAPNTSFPLESVFDFLHPNSARKTLTQACLTGGQFETRWRWNVTRSLLVERMHNGKRVPAPLLRMRAGDAMARAFPNVVACPENLPAGPLEVPYDHPLVRQTIEDCLTELMDIDGLLGVLEGLKSGRIERVAIDTPEPSAFARGILSAQPYAFLDDAPLEERRTQAVMTRRTLGVKDLDTIGELDPDAIARVRGEAWPQPGDAEEVHEALLWMGFVTDEEAARHPVWPKALAQLDAEGRVVKEAERWYAVEASREPKDLLRGRMEALGPIVSDDPVLLELEHGGYVLRTRFGGQQGWCDRRLLARIHRYTIERLRAEIQPVTAAQFLRFLACWQHADAQHKLDGPRGVAEVLAQLAGFELPAVAWERDVLPARVRGYRREWLDQLTLSGEFAWGRLWGGGSAPIKTTPVGFVLREDLDKWNGLMEPPNPEQLGGAARSVFRGLQQSGALFPQELQRSAELLPDHFEMGLGELIARGLVTCDAYGGLRQLLIPPSKRRHSVAAAGRWSLFRRHVRFEPDAAFVAKQLLKRTGVVFRRTLAREKHPVPWRDLLRVLRAMEARGEVRGGRFVAGFDGEQYALPEAVELLRAVRRQEPRPPVRVSAADPLNFRGILTPDERVAPTAKQMVEVG